MYTAKDAAKITFETYNCESDNEDDVIEKIFKAAQQGKRKLQLFDVKLSILKYLEESGFDINYETQIVSWEEEVIQVEMLSISGSLNTHVP